MKKCWRCGKRGLFLRLNTSGLCPNCASDQRRMVEKGSDDGIFVPHTSISLECSFSSYYTEIKQKTAGLLPAIPLSAWDGYISPSGGYVNFGRFQVTGINPKTNRKNKRIVEAQNAESAFECVRNMGLIAPFEVLVLPSLPPTERQLSYAKDLGAVIPDGACQVDISAIISRITDDDEGQAPEQLAHQAHIFGLKISRYHGRKAIMSISENLPRAKRGEFLLSLRAK